MDPEEFNMNEHFPNWKERNQEHLKILVELIAEIRNMAMRTKGENYMLVCENEEKPRVLRLYQGVDPTCFYL